MGTNVLKQAILACFLRFQVVGLVILISSSAWGYTPFDPEVERMVAGGLKYLEANMNASTSYAFGKAIDGGTGERVLAGYAHIKAAHDKDNPVVQQGLKAALIIVRGVAGGDDGDHTNSKTIYNAGISAMLLAEIDKKAYRKELEQLGRFFASAQFRGGGYGYHGDEKGDVSQTQYAMLGLWTINNAGVPIDFASVPKTANWLVRVQDPSGGWPYQGLDAGGGGKLVPQVRVSASMAIAGGSANLIAGDILQMWGDELSREGTGLPDMPKAVKRQSEGTGAATVRKVSMPSETILSTIERCQGYLSTNSPDPGKLKSAWPFFQLYTLERYESFREVAFGLDKDSSPAWYNSGVDFLKKQEGAAGGFDKSTEVTTSVNTAFAILFLIRSTQKAIEQVGKGTLGGGWSLPADTTKMTVDGTQIKGEPVADTIQDLLGLLEADDANSVDTNSIPENLKLAADLNARRVQVDRLERLVRGSQSYQARRVAARLLGQSDELRVVPTLIFALSDPDRPVRQYAIDGLSFISRKFDGPGLPEKPNSADIRKTQNAWRDWFLTIRPNYVFLD